FFSVTFLLFLFLFCFFSVLFIRLSFPTRRSSDLVLLDPADTVRELELVRWESRGPTIEPICDDLFGEGKLLLGRGISAQVAPDHLGLVEHGVFHFCVRPRTGQSLAQRLERAAHQPIGANRLY